MPQIMCAQCGTFLKVKQMGIKVRYGYYSGFFYADLYYCPNCGIEVISGFAEQEIFDPEAAVDYDFSA